MLTLTYFLLIEKAPFLQQVFPSFLIYVGILLLIGIPLLVIIGYTHYKRSPAFKSQQEITEESNPFIYKLHMGKEKNVIYPFHLLLSQIILKIAKNEKITDEEVNKMKGLHKKMNILLKGGYVGVGKRKLPFVDTPEDESEL